MREHDEESIYLALDELEAKARARYEEEVRAITLVRSLLNPRSGERSEDLVPLFDLRNSLVHSSPGATISKVRQPDARSQRVRITQEVRNAIEEIEGEFTQQTISELIERKYPGLDVHRGSVSNAISRIMERDERIGGRRIVLVEEGFGSTPNVYAKVGDGVMPTAPPRGEDAGDGDASEDGDTEDHMTRN